VREKTVIRLADERVAQDLATEQRAIASGLDYSEREIRVAVRNMANSIAGLRMGMGMMTSSLRTIRLYTGLIAVLLLIQVCLAIWR
jgi:hypothetical protein